MWEWGNCTRNISQVGNNFQEIMRIYCSLSQFLLSSFLSTNNLSLLFCQYLFWLPLSLSISLSVSFFFFPFLSLCLLLSFFFFSPPLNLLLLFPPLSFPPPLPSSDQCWQICLHGSFKIKNRALWWRFSQVRTLLSIISAIQYSPDSIERIHFHSYCVLQ